MGGGGSVEGFDVGDVCVAVFLGGGETGLELGQEKVGTFGTDRVVNIGMGG